MRANTIRLSSVQVKARDQVIYGNPELVQVLDLIARRKDTLKGLYAAKRDLRSQGKFARYQTACVKTEIAILEHEIARLQSRKLLLTGDTRTNGLDPDDDFTCPF